MDIDDRADNLGDRAYDVRSHVLVTLFEMAQAAAPDVQPVQTEPPTHTVRARAWPGHPRASGERRACFSWMAGPCPAMNDRIVVQGRYHSASAPEMISISSLVMTAWRVRL